MARASFGKSLGRKGEGLGGSAKQFLGSDLRRGIFMELDDFIQFLYFHTFAT